MPIPEETAMAELLERHRDDAAGVLLALAWYAGLTRDEMLRLDWLQVDFEAGALRLPDREAPLPPPLAETLRRWRARCGASPYVAVSLRYGRRMNPEAAGNLARAALDAGGLAGVTLTDLRHGCVRRLLRDHDWPYVLHVTGLAVSTWRNRPDWLDPPPEKAAPVRGAPPDELRLWRVLQAERDTPAGAALWLAVQGGLRPREISALTWADVDFDKNRLTPPGGTPRPMPRGLRQVLEALRRGRPPAADPHVVLGPVSGRPVPPARLDALTRTALIRGGVETAGLAALRGAPARDAARRQLLRAAEAAGSLTRASAAALLDCPPAAASRRLRALTRSGDLVRVGVRYYPAGAVTPPAEQRGALLAHIAAAGPVFRQEAAELLGIGPAQAGRLLKRLERSGDLVHLGQRYALPPEQADKSREM